MRESKFQAENQWPPDKPPVPSTTCVIGAIMLGHSIFAHLFKY